MKKGSFNGILHLCGLRCSDLPRLFEGIFATRSEEVEMPDSMEMLTLVDIQKILKVSRASIYLIRRDDPTFPKPVKLFTGRYPRWTRQSIEQWIKKASK